MATQLSMMNAALLELGEDAIASLPAQDPIGEAAEQIYPSVRDYALYHQPWSWNTTVTQLDLIDEDEDRQYRYHYNYIEPQIGNLRAVARTAKFTRTETDGWTRMGSQLRADFNPAFVEHQRDIGEEAYPTLFVAGLIPLLASRFAMFVVEDEAISRHYERIADMAFQKARQVDSQSRPVEQVQDFRLLMARLSGAGGYATGRPYEWAR